MGIFYIVFFKIISVLLSIFIGFLAGRFSNVERESISSLVFYFISPIVFFSIPASTNVTFGDIGISIIVFIISSCLCVFTYHIYKQYWKDGTLNLLAMSAGTANSGYFMLPIAAALFDDNTLNIYMMAIIGLNIYESSVGYYICARDSHSNWSSIKHVLRLPTFNAFIFGCLFSLAGFTLPDFLDDFTYGMRSAYSILGMIMIGLGLSKMQSLQIDVKYTISSFISKFVFFPLGIYIFMMLDEYVFHLYNNNYYDALLLLSLAPIAGNTMIFAGIWKLNPERAATTVLLSSIFALLYIPIMASLLMRDLG